MRGHFLRAINRLDPDAASYIAAVEAADGQALEAGVRNAINAFVTGCKADAIWTAIKACCILAGARTLNGALVPLVGAAPTNVNFVSGDYNRKTGLVGDGSTKYLNSNRASNADPQNNIHACVYASSIATAAPTCYIGTFVSGTYVKTMYSSSGGTLVGRANAAADASSLSAPGRHVNGLLGISRQSSTSMALRGNGGDTVVSDTSGTPLASSSLWVFALNNVSAPSSLLASNARLSYYSIGEYLNFGLLDARVTTLMNALAAAIP